MLQTAGESTDLHPLIQAAWLHHAFVAIHPFDDGNGRVARALAILVLLQNHYAPLVVHRDSREKYLTALGEANGGHLRGLIRLFAELEIVALRAELEHPVADLSASPGPVNVARAYVERLKARRESDAVGRATAAAVLADAVNTRVSARLDELGKGSSSSSRP